tara:strand:- start:383 stop:526 length:144 start_codon:yes stop_codon:yes gene_type:complete
MTSVEFVVEQELQKAIATVTEMLQMSVEFVVEAVFKIVLEFGVVILG